MRSIFLASLLLLMLSPAHAAEMITGEMSTPACTEIGCDSGVIFRSDPGKVWEPGQYDFFIMSDGMQIICKGQLPLKPCDEGASFKCSNTKVTVGESGCALPAENHAVADVRIEGYPKTVILKLSHDRQPLFHHKLSPVYTESRPNGPLCEPVCNMAILDLETGSPL